MTDHSPQPAGGRTGVGTPVPEDAAERLRRRYPPARVPRPVLIGLFGALAAIGLAWLVWSGLYHANPPVSAEVTSYRVLSDSRVAVSFAVERPDPSRPVLCRVSAQAVDFQRVGERAVPVPAGTERVVDVTVELTTLRRAQAVSLDGCAPA